MKKNICFLLFFALVSTALIGCGKPQAEPQPSAEQSVADSEESSGPEDAEDTEPKPEEAESESDTNPEEKPENTAESERALAQTQYAYAEVLSEIRGGFVLPDGIELDSSEYSLIEENEFAIADVDGDGHEELIIYHTTSPATAGLTACILEYYPETGRMEEILWEYPALTFYENGILQAEASHNQSPGNMWPYTVYQYDEASDTYAMAYEVWSWEKAMIFENFPDDIDIDGDGLIYQLLDHKTGITSTLDNSDFENWYQKTFGEAVPLEIPFKSLSYDNISSLYSPYMEIIRQNILAAATDKDLAFLYMSQGLEAVLKYLSTSYHVSFTDGNEGEDGATGTLDGQEVCYYIPGPDLFSYTSAIDGVTLLGIAPGMDAQEAASAIVNLGFRQEGEMGGGFCTYVTGSGSGNYSISLMIENNVVTYIDFRYYNRYVS